MPHGTPSSAPYLICRRTTRRLVCSSRLPAGARITSDGIRYSNIDPDHEISAEPRSTGVRPRPEAKPVARRHVALGDRDEARQARLGGQQVVAVGIETCRRRRGSRSRAAAARGRTESRTPSRRTSLPRSCERRQSPLERSGCAAERASAAAISVDSRAAMSAVAVAVLRRELRSYDAQDARCACVAAVGQTRQGRDRVEDRAEQRQSGKCSPAFFEMRRGRRRRRDSPTASAVRPRADGSRYRCAIASAQASNSAPAPSPRSVGQCSRDVDDGVGMEREFRQLCRPRPPESAVASWSDGGERRRAPRPAAFGVTVWQCADRRRARASDSRVSATRLRSRDRHREPTIGRSIISRQAFPSAIRCPARFPLSTEETYFGSSGRRSRVSYQL